MRIFSFAAGLVALVLSCGFVLTIMKFSAMYQEIGVGELPMIAGWVMDTGGAFPCLVAGVLGIVTMVAAVTNMRRWLPWLSWLSLVAAFGQIPVIAVSLWLPFVTITEKMADQAEFGAGHGSLASAGESCQKRRTSPLSHAG